AGQPLLAAQAPQGCPGGREKIPGSSRRHARVVPEHCGIVSANGRLRIARQGGEGARKCGELFGGVDWGLETGLTPGSITQTHWQTNPNNVIAASLEIGTVSLARTASFPRTPHGIRSSRTAALSLARGSSPLGQVVGQGIRCDFWIAHDMVRD